MNITRRKVINAVNKLLEDADNSRNMSFEIRDSFGDCPAFTDKHLEAYYKEEAAEYFMYYLLKEDHSFRNGKGRLNETKRS